MSHLFERALAARCEENADVAILRAQWDFDRRLLSSALQSVGQTFPHYSRHDASHSHTILIQIERVLGPERIAALGATDLWLLLAAAYHHDAGMIVTNAQLEAVWAEPSFRDYLRVTRDDGDADFSAAARWILDPPFTVADTGGAPKIDERWPLHVVRAVRLLVAEHRRREHASRGAEVVLKPELIGLASPRTGMIPKRLFGFLARICASHGDSFESVMTLPRTETGVGSDVCHPRFVASMLRLGDLLDLDNGRFCPVMLATFGPLPESSHAHVAKHASITRLRIDGDSIEVEAECDGAAAENGGYEACETWFEMLRTELRNQQQKWTQIAPSPGFGALPTAGRIEVRLRDLLSEGRMDVDATRLVRVLQGANLYKDATAYVRELLQNAVDATLLRLWAEQKEDLRGEPGRAIETARKLLRQWPIRVAFSRISGENAKGSDPPDGKAWWRLTVADHGTGISRGDLESIRRVGNSPGRNREKAALVAGMPEWLRPSGIFGIGLQSLFLKTDEIEIRSRSYMTGDRLHVRLLGGRRRVRPAVLVRSEDGVPSRSYGTVVQCEMLLDTVPSRITWSPADKRVTHLLGDYDFLLHRDLPIEAAELQGAVETYRETSWVPIEWGERSVDPGAAPVAPVPPTGGEAWHYDAETGIRIDLEFHRGTVGRYRIGFRGAPVTTEMGGPLLSANVDILSGTAEATLTLDRAKLREDSSRETMARISDAVGRTCVLRVEELRGSGVDAEQLAIGSLALLLTGSPSAGEEWRRVAVAGTTFDAIDRIDSLRVIRLNFGGGDLDGVTAEQGDILVLRGESRIIGLVERFLIRRGFHQQVESIAGTPRTSSTQSSYLYSKSQLPPFASDAVLRDVIAWSLHSHGVGSRRLLPVVPGFERLALADEVPGMRAQWAGWAASRRILSPFTVDHASRIRILALPELLEFTILHAQARPPRAEVADLLAKFIRDVDSLMKVVDRWRSAVNYNVDAAVAELARLRDE